VQKAYDLAKEVLTRAARFPRDQKFTLGDRLSTQAMDVLELVVAAQYAPDKAALLQRAHTRLDQLRMTLRLAMEMGPLSNKGFEHVSGIVVELGKQVVGWRKHAEARRGEDVQKPLS
jgi:hypothetical protein